MKWTKGRIINLMLVALLALYLFTPVGFYIKVYMNRLFSFNPVPVEKREQKNLEDYNWLLSDLDGNTFDFKTQKGNVILINFWATWCPPCVAELPSLQKLHYDYQDSITFMFVARDRKDRVSKFLEKHGYVLPVYYESGFTPKILFSNSIPSTYIIDREGRIVVAETGSMDWNDESIRKLLDELLKK